MTAVLDASVALKWQFEDEEVTSSATALLENFVEGKIELIVPTLFPYEIINAINVAINRKRIEEEVGYRAINYITSLGIELRSFDDLIGSTFYMARRIIYFHMTVPIWHWQKKKSVISLPEIKNYLIP